MDHIDRMILKCLSDNARMRASDIAKQAAMSVSSITERIKKLEQSGVILKYTTILDPVKFSHTFQTLIGIASEHPSYIDSLSDQLIKDPNVVECLTLTGDLDFLVRVSATSPEHFQQIHLRIAKLEGVKGIKSYYVLDAKSNPQYSLLPND